MDIYPDDVLQVQSPCYRTFLILIGENEDRRSLITGVRSDPYKRLTNPILKYESYTIFFTLFFLEGKEGREKYRHF